MLSSRAFSPGGEVVVIVRPGLGSGEALPLCAASPSAPMGERGRLSGLRSSTSTPSPTSECELLSESRWATLLPFDSRCVLGVSDAFSFARSSAEASTAGVTEMAPAVAVALPPAICISRLKSAAPSVSRRMSRSTSMPSTTASTSPRLSNIPCSQSLLPWHHRRMVCLYVSSRSLLSVLMASTISGMRSSYCLTVAANVSSSSSVSSDASSASLRMPMRLLRLATGRSEAEPSVGACSVPFSTAPLAEVAAEVAVVAVEVGGAVVTSELLVCVYFCSSALAFAFDRSNAAFSLAAFASSTAASWNSSLS